MATLTAASLTAPSCVWKHVHSMQSWHCGMEWKARNVGSLIMGPHLHANFCTEADAVVPVLQVPQSFWTRLAGKYGIKSYYTKKGEEAAIKNAVAAITSCLREEPGRFMCSKIQGDIDEEKQTSGRFGGLF